MTNKNEEKSELEIEKNIVEVTHKVEDFYHKNNKQIITVFAVIVILAAGYMGVKKFYLDPMEDDVQREMFMAQKYFDMDSFNLALKGNDQFKGFADLASEYGMSKGGNLANYYAGICYLRTGAYQEAIDALEGFDTDNKLVGPLATGAIGDAYAEMGELSKAAKHYIKAAKMSKNKLTSPVFYKKAGIVFEEAKEYADAIDAFSAIKKDYPESQEASDIDKYIARVSQLKESN
jgi:tetratricopeptide (TPR) repeat protein